MSNNDPTSSPLTHPAIVLALSVPLLLGGLYSRNLVDSIVGPLAVAVGDDQVVVAAPGLLYRLDQDGGLLDVDTTIIAPGTRDAGLLWLGDALLASPGTDGTLLRCTGDECAPFSQDRYTPTGPVHAEIDGGIVWLAELEADRLHRFRVDGKRIDMPLSNLSRPGAVLRTGDRVLVANTGEGRLDGHRIHKTGLDYGEKFAEFSLGEDDGRVDRPLRIIAAGEDGFRALFTNAARTRGVLVNIDAEGKTTPVDGPFSNPVSIAWLGEDLLVVDEDLMQIVRLDADGEATLFGDEDFNAQLSSQRTTREVLHVLWPVLVLLSSLAAAIGSSWMLLQLVRRRGDPAREVTPGSNGIIWMPTEQELLGERTKRNLVIAAPAALFPALAAGWLGSMLAAVGWVLVVGAVAAVPAYLAAGRARLPLDTRIGIRGKRLVIADTEHGQREFPLDQVRWSESRLQPTAAERIELARNGVALYHPATLASSLLPQLNPALRDTQP